MSAWFAIPLLLLALLVGGCLAGGFVCAAIGRRS